MPTEIPALERSSDVSYRDASSQFILQLPRITLPKFSGDFAEWENFRSLFESFVASNDAIPNTQKLHYLKTSLDGDAAKLIKNLKISDANYVSAWQLLLDEYDKSALIHTHIHSFAGLPKMKTENVAELKKLRDTASAALAALKNLGCPIDKWDDLLVYLISQKFSPRTRNEWSLKRGASDAPAPYTELNEFLTLRIRGFSDFPDSSTPVVESALRSNKTRSSVHSVSALKCVNCAGNHYIGKYDDFLSKAIAQRDALVKQKRLCFNCLRAGHFTSKCPSKGRCAQCRRSHHSLLHQLKADPLRATASPPPASEPSISH